MYEQYQAARDAAWRALLECNIRALPVDLNQVAEHYAIEIVRYSDCALTQIFNPEAVSGDGFIVKVNARKIIFLNDKIKTRGRRRFTLCHELGHGVLGHPLDHIVTRNSEADSSDPMEMQANVFARDLLAPACVLHALGVTTAQEIMQICSISKTSAEIRANRLRLLRERDKFGTSSLERQVREQFDDFIRANRL